MARAGAKPLPARPHGAHDQVPTNRVSTVTGDCLTDTALRRGTFASVPDVISSIQEYIDAHNEDPNPYKWTATAESILAKVARARTTLNTVN